MFSINCVEVDFPDIIYFYIGDYILDVVVFICNCLKRHHIFQHVSHASDCSDRHLCANGCCKKKSVSSITVKTIMCGLFMFVVIHPVTTNLPDENNNVVVFGLAMRIVIAANRCLSYVVFGMQSEIAFRSIFSSCILMWIVDTCKLRDIAMCYCINRRFIQGSARGGTQQSISGHTYHIMRYWGVVGFFCKLVTWFFVVQKIQQYFHTIVFGSCLVLVKGLVYGVLAIRGRCIFSFGQHS